MDNNIKTGLIIFFSMIAGAILFNVLSTNALQLKLLNTAKNDFNCNNINGLENYSYCLQSELSKFYNYNISNKGKELTFDELKLEGGVCSHYSEWYVDQLKTKGYNAEKKSIAGDNIAHAFAIAWDNDVSTYCVLDQLNVNCWSLR